MSFEKKSKRAVSTLIEIDAGDHTLRSQKRARKETEVQLKRARSKSPDSRNNNKLQHTQENDYERPPVIYLNPSQRLDLLRKRQKWRRSHLYNLQNPRGNLIEAPKTSTGLVLQQPVSSRYAEVSTQTEIVPELKSRSLITKETAKSEAERKLLSGVFSGTILYDENELNEANNREKSPVKFTSKKRIDVGSLPLSSNSMNDLLSDRKKLVQSQPKLPEIQKPAPASVSIDLSEEVAVDSASKLGPSSAFNFLGSKRLEEITAPTKSTDEEPKKTFSFGGPPSAASKEQSPLFSSAPNQSDKPAFSFGSSTTEPLTNKEDNAPSSFSFGTKRDSPADEEKPKPSLFGSSSTASKPTSTFSLGGISAPAKENEQLKSTFNFGASSSEKKKIETLDEDDDQPAAKKSTFSFGAINDAASKPSGGFNFGSKPSTNEPNAKTHAKLPSFDFSAKSATEDKPKPAFNFGSKPVEEEKEASKSTFSFGAKPATEDKEAPKPFSFGSSSDSKPLFGLGSSDSKSTQPQPFSFGSTASEKKVEEVNSAETNGGLFGKSSTSSFSNGASDAPKATTSLFGSSSSLDKPAEAKSAFNFGATTLPTSSTEPPKSTFNFGEAATTNKTSKPSFSFGAATKPSFDPSASSSTPATKPALFGGDNNAPVANSTFNFGSTTKPSEPKPVSFNFGGASKPQDPASIFGSINNNASQPNTTSAFGFGSTSTPAQPSAFGQGNNNNSSFNFGAAPKPSLPSTNSAFGQANTGFNFGANTSTPAAPTAFGGPTSNGGGFNFGSSSAADPAAIFGQSNGGGFGSQLQQPQPQAPSGFGFGGSQQQGFGGTPAFGANAPFGGAAAPPTPTGTPIQSRVPGRKIAQMRQRRH